MLTQFWELWQTEKRSFFSLAAWLDAGKTRLQRKIRAFSCRKVSVFRKHVSSLEHVLFHLDPQAEGGEDVQQLIGDTKSELKELHRQQAKGCRIHANVQWAKEAEASTWKNNVDRCICLLPLRLLRVLLSNTFC